MHGMHVLQLLVDADADDSTDDGYAYNRVQLSRWVYALMAAVDTPVQPEVVGALRHMYRNLCPSDDHTPLLRALVTISFRQMDLLCE